MSAGALIGPLAISGSNTNTGTPNAGGSFFAYIPGTTTQTTIYSDAAATVAVTQPVTLDNAGRIPYSTYPNGIYCVGPIRLFVLAADGTTVISDTVFQSVAGNIAVSNASFTATTIDGVLTAAGASFGGQDFKYKESGSATSRLVQDKFREIGISVKDYGALGDNNNNDTTAIQAAINRVIALGGGVVLFPPGTYKINALLTAAPSTGLTLKGAGSSASVINQITSATDALQFAASTGLVIDGLGTTGGGVVMTSATTCRISGCSFGGSSNGYGLSTTSGNNVSVVDSIMSGSAEGIFTSGTANLQMRGGTLASSPIGIVVAGSSNQVYCSSVIFGGSTAIHWNAGASGSGLIIPSFVFVDCPTLGGRTSFDYSALANEPGIYQRDCAFDLSQQSAAIGSTFVPVAYTDNQLTAASGGAGTMTVSNPAPIASQLGKKFTISFVNAAGGAVTWSMGTAYVLNGAVPTTDTDKTSIQFYFDGTKFREQFRAQTT